MSLCATYCRIVNAEDLIQSREMLAGTRATYIADGGNKNRVHTLRVNKDS